MTRETRNKSPLRNIAKATLAIGIPIALIHAVHAVTLDRIIVYNEVPFYSERVPAELDGYRIAFVTDTHSISKARLRGVVEALNERQVDLLVLGGDFARTEAATRRSLELLSQVVTTDGIFGVEGNHDRYRKLFRAMEANGIVPLSNSGLYIRENFYLAGVEDHPDIATAIAGAGPDSFRLLVSHHPDVTMRQDTLGVDLVLSGHTHGGQVTFFGLWAPALPFVTRYADRFNQGWAESRDETPVYVSRGVGEYTPRVFARPEVVLITLRRLP